MNPALEFVGLFSRYGDTRFELEVGWVENYSLTPNRWLERNQIDSGFPTLSPIKVKTVRFWNHDEWESTDMDVVHLPHIRQRRCHCSQAQQNRQNRLWRLSYLPGGIELSKETEHEQSQQQLWSALVRVMTNHQADFLNLKCYCMCRTRRSLCRCSRWPWLHLISRFVDYDGLLLVHSSHSTRNFDKPTLCIGPKSKMLTTPCIHYRKRTTCNHLRLPVVIRLIKSFQSCLVCYFSHKSPARYERKFHWRTGRQCTGRSHHKISADVDT